jgi:hypothetical protein
MRTYIADNPKTMVYTGDEGKDHRILDVLLHCFAPHIPGLYTLCGKPYENVMFANDPKSFQYYAGVEEENLELCHDCLTHEDLPLALLGDT